ncbi:MAG TPA: hypothetical protein VMR41_05930 [Patescibacteria group bacterium]|nr:hypothetical protein [Patescibacteria group bacterium]
MIEQSDVRWMTVAEYEQDVRLAKRERRSEAVGVVLYKAKKAAEAAVFVASASIFGLKAVDAIQSYNSLNAQAHAVHTPLSLDNIDHGMYELGQAKLELQPMEGLTHPWGADAAADIQAAMDSFAVPRGDFSLKIEQPLKQAYDMLPKPSGEFSKPYDINPVENLVNQAESVVLTQPDYQRARTIETHRSDSRNVAAVTGLLSFLSLGGLFRKRLQRMLPKF